MNMKIDQELQKKFEQQRDIVTNNAIQFNLKTNIIRQKTDLNKLSFTKHGRLRNS
jgi:hypothetical protein